MADGEIPQSCPFNHWPPTASVQQSLRAVRAGLSAYAKQLVERIQRGMKVAFATSIVHMLQRALWIVALAVIVVLFIPELPLRSRE